MKRTISLAILFLFGNVLLFSQASKKATIDKKGTITLNEGPIASTYEVDFSTLPFANFEATKSYFQRMNVEDITVEVDKEKKTATIKLNIQKHPDWSKAIWKAYLQRQVKPISKE